MTCSSLMRDTIIGQITSFQSLGCDMPRPSVTKQAVTNHLCLRLSSLGLAMKAPIPASLFRPQSSRMSMSSATGSAYTMEPSRGPCGRAADTTLVEPIRDSCGLTATSGTLVGASVANVLADPVPVTDVFVLTAGEVLRVAVRNAAENRYLHRVESLAEHHQPIPALPIHSDVSCLLTYFTCSLPLSNAVAEIAYLPCRDIIFSLKRQTSASVFSLISGHYIIS